ASAVAVQRDPGALPAEADQAGIVARPRGEPLGTHMQRLEQVRFSGPFRTAHEQKPGLQLELEPSIRAEISQRELVDDQPAEGVACDARLEGVRASPVPPSFLRI